MDIFLRASALIIIAVILLIVVPKNAKEFAGIVSLCACICLAVSACYILEPVLSFVNELSITTGIDNDMFSILIKITGIGILSEIISLICVDSGNSAMGKGTQLLGTAVILWMSLPLFRLMIETIKTVLTF